MNTDNVLVAENPVMWETRIRCLGVEPPALTEGNDVVPYYTQPQAQEKVDFLSDEEIAAIRKIAPHPGDLLTKVEGADGSVSYVGLNNSSSISTFRENELRRECVLVRDFLQALGGCGFVERVQRKGLKKKSIFNILFRGKGKGAGGGGEVSYEQSSRVDESFGSENYNHIEFSTKKPNLDIARQLLRDQQELSEFKSLYDSVSSGTQDCAKPQGGIHRFKCFQAGKSSLVSALDVGARYKVIDVKLCGKLKTEIEETRRIEEVFKWQITFSGAQQ